MRNLVRRAVQRRADARAGAVGGDLRDEAPSLDLSAVRGRQRAVERNHGLAGLRRCSRSVQFALNHNARIDAGLIGVENHAAGGAPNRLLNQVLEKPVGRVDPLEVRHILDVGRRELHRHADGSKLVAG